MIPPTGGEQPFGVQVWPADRPGITPSQIKEAATTSQRYRAS